jgi:transcriptional regulator with XRE-family HTH domain
MNFATGIRIARSLRNLTKKELAKRVDLDASYISLLETGKREPSFQVVERIANVLHIPVHLLVLISSDPQSLKFISESDVTFLGKQFLAILIASKEDNEPVYSDSSAN